MSKQIEEVMALVDSYVKASIEYDIHLDDVPLYDESMDLAREQLNKKRSTIEAKLRELLPVWLPIESAPKTGEKVIGREEDFIQATGFSKIGQQWEWGCCAMDWKPTHYMPLPKAPE